MHTGPQSSKTLLPIPTVISMCKCGPRTVVQALPLLYVAIGHQHGKLA